ncbi:MFS transporter [Pseudonocardia pini]|uniref:MFS transporter n=1 Tax=Pseudonocardia pini TaxID=2758030 RepID=UPI0015F02783|nr:MFS transporter [Pseudonocardia pini]
MTTEPHHDTAPAPSRMGKVAAGTTIGTAIEWYDYFIFGTAAALVFGRAFFPDFSPLAGTLASFATFAVGFVARPLGAAIFGHFGDRLGRKPMMVWTLMLMGVATVLIGLLPTYDTIGIWAPILLVTLRVVQGIGVGGEWGAAALMAVEHSPPARRGFFGSLPAAGAPLGVLLSSGVFAALSATLPAGAFDSWGWRIPFLISAVLIGVGFWIRASVEESPVFEGAAAEKTERSGAPLLDVLRTHPLLILAAAGTYMATAAAFYVSTTWVISYVTTTAETHSRSTVLTVGLCVSAVSVVCNLAYGTLADRIGRRRLFFVGTIATAAYAFPFFWLVDSGSLGLYVLALVISAIVLAAISAAVASYFAELFPTRVRYSGVSLSFQVAAVMGGGFTPLICTALYSWVGSTWIVAAYIVALALVGLGCLLAIPRLQAAELATDPLVVGDDLAGAKTAS